MNGQRISIFLYKWKKAFFISVGARGRGEAEACICPRRNNTILLGVQKVPIYAPDGVSRIGLDPVFRGFVVFFRGLFSGQFRPIFDELHQFNINRENKHYWQIWSFI